MFQVAYDYPQPWPKEGALLVDVQFTGEIAVSPTTARRRAAGFLAGHVTMMVRAGKPVLVFGERLRWRVPACLHLPGLGRVTEIGTVDVDALTGDIIPPSSSQIAYMQRRAHEIATHLD